MKLLAVVLTKVDQSLSKSEKTHGQYNQISTATLYPLINWRETLAVASQESVEGSADLYVLGEVAGGLRSGE